MSQHSEREEKILEMWRDKGIFEKTLTKESPKGEFIFYDGPPFANGMPHYGHILAGIIKDVVPRFKTMSGYHVPRRWGWDCHGLPVENLVEKELNLKSKKDVITYGLEKFNKAAKDSVMRYADEWRMIVPRLGRFVDMDNDYRTMDSSYTESVWWSFKRLYDKGLVYEDFKSMNLCPRCETTLSNFEVAQGYKDITDISVTVKFKVIGGGSGQTSGNVYMLAWTTTPWTLPGNVALAVNPHIEYVRVKITDGADLNNTFNQEDSFILAKSRLQVLKNAKYEIMETLSGSRLVGTAYEPLFNYYSGGRALKGKENGWKVYSADFVTTEDGTGIVHIAPAFGADDYSLLKKYDLPFVQHVSTDGKFKKEVVDFAGQSVKPVDTNEEKDAHQKADIEVIKWLAHHGKLFSKEKLTHSYPHCWRCDTPLLNYAASSWFVRVTSIKNRLIKENNKISWVPTEVGQGRFGNWLEGARDWAISRSRFWGAPIPVWKEIGGDDARSTQGKIHIMGSIADLRKYSKANNTYYVMRHGEAEHNVKCILNGDPKNTHHLTSNGRVAVERSVSSLKSKGVKLDKVFASPLARGTETAAIVGKVLGISKNDIVVDTRLKEIGMGELEGKDDSVLSEVFPLENRYGKTTHGIESYSDIRKRLGDFIYGLESKYEGKTILLITHASPAMILTGMGLGFDNKDALQYEEDNYIDKAEIRKLDFVPLPHDSDYKLDLHRPYIDELKLKTPQGILLERVPDVFDCWYESGSMPYASIHYPFAKQNASRKPSDLVAFDPRRRLFSKTEGYPADFIAEGVDQTRGWFYSLMVLGMALFGRAPYRKVIANGLILAEDGQKMSKRKNNYPDPSYLIEKYGTDPLRLYLLSSPVVHGEDLCFNEKGVDEVSKKIVNRLLNVLSFYEMYSDRTNVTKNADGVTGDANAEVNVLDAWVYSRLSETIATVTSALEAGELDRATRPFFDFTDDLSTWYLRRSRDRFKSNDVVDRKSALETTQYVLETTAKLLAPFAPFVAEEIYSRVGGKLESVHLESWPKAHSIDRELLSVMKSARNVVSLALEARMESKINVRQPLQLLKIKNPLDNRGRPVSADIESLIRDEINVKGLKVDHSIKGDVLLDTTITPQLKEEGMVRELTRAIQDLRKEKCLTPKDLVTLRVDTSPEGKGFFDRNKDKISAIAGLGQVDYSSLDSEQVMIGDLAFKFSL